MFRAPKRNPFVLGPVCLLGLAGFWLERYVLVAPSLSRRHIPFGWIEVLTTLGFLGLFGLVTMPGVRRAPNATLEQARKEAA
jgi:hypothetical protein